MGGWAERVSGWVGREGEWIEMAGACRGQVFVLVW